MTVKLRLLRFGMSRLDIWLNVELAFVINRNGAVLFNKFFRDDLWLITESRADQVDKSTNPRISSNKIFFQCGEKLVCFYNFRELRVSWPVDSCLWGKLG